MNKLFKVLGDKYPQYRSQFDQVNTLANKAVKGLDAAAPVVEKTLSLISTAQEKAMVYQLEQYFPLLLGLALAFFGGSFSTLVTVVETIRLVCWEDMRSSYVILKRNYDVAAAESRKDDLADADGNGIADVLEIKKDELLSRKLQLFVKSVDIDEVHSASRTLMAAFFSVVAALRVRAARSLALAGSLANTAKESFPLEQIMRESLPPEQQKWSALIADSVFSGLSVALAFGLRSLEGYVHSAVRGSSMFVQNAVLLAQKRGMIEVDMGMKSGKPRVLMGVIALMAVLFQVANKGCLPFPMNVLLFPLTFLEWLLSGFVSYCL